MMKNIAIIGDTHGNHKYIKYRMKMLSITDMDLFHVGDFGVGFSEPHIESKQLADLNKFLESKNCHLYVIRGNHDNPVFFNGEYEHKYSNLHLMSDYSIVNVSGNNILMVGGAISIDRGARKTEMLEYARYNKFIENYWYDEVFVLDIDKLSGMNNIDYVITHSSPNITFPYNDTSNIENSHGYLVENMVFQYDDTSLKNELNKERSDLTKMYDILKENKSNNIKKWFMGHFHTHNEEKYNGTDFIILDVDEFYSVYL